MLNGIRSLLGLQIRAPANAASPTGRFSILGGRCSGAVVDRYNPGSRPLKITIENAVERSVLAQASANSASGAGHYEFAFDLPAGFDTGALLAGGTGVFAENAYALKGKLELERASEVALIKQQQDPARTVLFDLTFAQGGSAEPFLGSGWGRLETALCCTEGPLATLDVPGATSPDAQYELTIDCFAFFRPPHIESQRMTITLNGFPHVVNMGFRDEAPEAPVSLIYPRQSLSASDAVHIEFDLPNCFRPIDYQLNEDTRQLSFGLRQITFSQLSFSGSKSELESLG